MYDRCPPLTRPDLGPTPTWSGSGADGPKTRSQMFVGVSPPGCLWWQSQSYGRFSSRGRGQSWCSRQEGHRGAPRSFILLPQMGQLQLVLPRLLQRCHALALGAFLPGFAAPQPTQKPFSGKKKKELWSKNHVAFLYPAPSGAIQGRQTSPTSHGLLQGEQAGK